MSSLRRILASRANGAQSHGPVSAEGKARSAQNAISHGLTAETVVLSFESRERFQALLADCIVSLQPADAAQTHLVEEYAATLWRIRRALSLETCLLEHEFEEQEKDIANNYENPHIGTRLAVAAHRLHDHSRTLPNIHRQESRLHRRADLLLKRLNTLKALTPAPPETAQAPGCEEGDPHHENFPVEPSPISGHFEHHQEEN